MAAVRHGDIKVHFMVQEAHGFDVWKNPYTPLGWPSMVKLRADPFERGWHESEMYLRWMAENMWLFVPAQAFASQWLETFKEFPPRGGTTLGIDGVIKQLGNPPARQ